MTWKLADDPTLNGNALIDEFFDRYYGSAAVPMRIVYELIEQAYASNYVNCFGEYLLALEDVAWTKLGTQSRTAQLGWLMEQAREPPRRTLRSNVWPCSIRGYGDTCKPVDRITSNGLDFRQISEQ